MHADRRGHAHEELAEMELREEEAEGGGLHRGLDRERAAGLLVVPEGFAPKIGNYAAEDVE